MNPFLIINLLYNICWWSTVLKTLLIKLEYQTFDSVIEPLKILLEFIRKQKKKSKLIFSASSEIFGESKKRINENTEKKPSSPYGLSKLIGLELVKSYRETFKLPVFSIIFLIMSQSLDLMIL